MNDQTSSTQTNGTIAQPAIPTTNLQTEILNESSEPRQPVAAPQSDAPALRNPKTRRVRNGKIAALPLELRECVSYDLYCGRTHDEIAQDLNEDGYPDITRYNIGSWAKGGYQDWLKTNQTLKSISLKTEAFTQHTYYTDKDALQVNKLNNFMLAARMNEVIEHLDPKELARLVATDPELFFRFIKEEFNRQEIERKSEYQVQDRNIELQQRAQHADLLRLLSLPESDRQKVLEHKKAELAILKEQVQLQEHKFRTRDQGSEFAA